MIVNTNLSFFDKFVWRWRDTVRSRFMPTAPSSCGKIFVLPTSQFQNAIAHFGLLRRTLLAQIWRDTLRRRFFEHSECYRKNCLTRDFGRPQGLSRPCGCVDELRSISLPEKNKNRTLWYGFYFWRRWRDSNSRTAINSYTISNRAPSTGLGDISIFGHQTII